MDQRINLFFLILIQSILPSYLANKTANDIICTTEEYVRAGLEFENCQRTGIDSIEIGEAPCPSLRTLVDECAGSVKHCFTQHGFQRGLKILFDTLAIHYPEVNNCDVLAELHGVEIARLDEGYQCTISEEVALSQLITKCNNKIQGDLANKLMHYSDGGPSVSTSTEPGPQDVRELLCRTLQRIRDECLEPLLQQCYGGTDYVAHFQYLLTNLKISGNLLATKLTNVTDVQQCPVFHDSMGSSSDAQTRQDSSLYSLVIGLSVAVVVVVFILIGMMARVMGSRLRIWPRLKAWMTRTPYEDFDPSRMMNTQANQPNPNETAMERRSSEKEQVAEIEVVEELPPEETVTTSADNDIGK